MNPLLILLVAVLPTPKFEQRMETLPTPMFVIGKHLPAPLWEPKVEEEVVVNEEDIPTLARLPGRVGWYRCPQCGSGNCGSQHDPMFFGQHLLDEHEQDRRYLEKLTFEEWKILHDNLHNMVQPPPVKVKPLPVVPKSQTFDNGCSDGSCGVRWFRRWRGR